MNYGMCPNCFNKLTKESAIQTGLSEIFKGNNSYLLCKNCQQVLLYNMNRDMIFDLDEYKEDKDVIAEINKLLSEIDNHYEVQSNANCTGDCNSCPGCAVTEQAYQRRTSKPKQNISCDEPVTQDAPIEKDPNPESVIKTTLSNSILAVNIKDPTLKLILIEQSDLDDIDINEWVFFEMNPITIEVEVKKFYNIIRP